MGFSFLPGRDGYQFSGSRGGNDTRLHCLGTVEYLGFFFITCTSSGLFFSLLSLLRIVSLYIGSGLGETRYSLLPCHLVCGWLGLVRAKPLACGVVSFEIDILGVSRGVRVIDHMLKWLCSLFITLLYLSLPSFHLYFSFR
jgi:hypothetical protein